MCGINGIFSAEKEADSDLLAAMSGRLSHRGPDGGGIYLDGNVGLAHRRLSIIDLSNGAAQPMSNENGTLWLVFNGEIYNYPELREELIASGHTFRSNSDTEVILHAYEEWGVECLTKFNGMWGFVIYDKNKNEMFCSRDRFGIKPFYFATAGRTFLFASEIKALLEHPEVGKKPNDTNLMAYLAWGILDHNSETMFDGISQLRPGHYMYVRAGRPEKPVKYWDLTISEKPISKKPVTDDEAASHLLELMRDSVRLRLRSDVPVGTCLSGGMDSSTITALINEQIRNEAPHSVGNRQKTFSACYEDKRYDEREYMEEVVQATGAHAHEVFPDPAQLKKDLNHLIYIQDEPFGSLSIYAQYSVMKLAGEHVKVILDGQGADEQLAGYIGYQASYIKSLTHHPLIAARDALQSFSHHHNFFYDAFRQIKARSKRRSLLCGEIPKIDRYSGTLDRVLAREIHTTNLPALLHYEDRNSMAFSIESRVPFMDYRLVEYIAALPLDQKIRHGVTKYVLRKAIKGVVPESIRCRMDKMGFVTPEEVWMKGELRPLVLEILQSKKFYDRPYWNADAVLQSYREYLNGDADYSPEIWRIVCTELWIRMFFEESNPRENTI